MTPERLAEISNHVWVWRDLWATRDEKTHPVIGIALELFDALEEEIESRRHSAQHRTEFNDYDT